MTSFIVALTFGPVNKKCTVLSESYDFLYLVDSLEQVEMVCQLAGAHFPLEIELFESVPGHGATKREAISNALNRCCVNTKNRRDGC